MPQPLPLPSLTLFLLRFRLRAIPCLAVTGFTGYQGQSASGAFSTTSSVHRVDYRFDGGLVAVSSGGVGRWGGTKGSGRVMRSELVGPLGK